MTLNKVLDSFNKTLEDGSSYASVTRVHRSLGPYKRCSTIIKRVGASGTVEDIVDYTSDLKKVPTEEEDNFIEENELKALREFFLIVKGKV